ncbi:MAG: hypothetical protein HZC05_00010 [Candidatus Magasanikbacteria bacterium]|nr:hypothetical protein [Candidatus Magasanikbacteria bacterium]
MANLENRPNFEQISQIKPAKKMTPSEAREELHQGDGKTDETKPMSFPTEDKMPGAKKINKIGLDKGEQFRLQDEIDKMQGEMDKQMEIISKLWAGDKDQSKAEKQKEKIKVKFEPRIAELQNKLKEEFGERENLEGLLPQLKKQAEESDAKRAAKIREKNAKKDLTDAYKKLVDMEDILTEVTAKRSGAIMRLFRGKNDSRELDYQKALKAVEEAKNGVEEAEQQAEKNIPTEVKPKAATIYRRGTLGLAQPFGIKLEMKKNELTPKLSPKKPAIIAGEHKIVFKEEPIQAQRKVEVNLPPAQESEREIAPEAVSDAKKQLVIHIKNMFFKQESSGELILKNAALMERLADANFQGEQQILNKAILDTKEEMIKLYKLTLEEQLKLEGAKFNDLAEGGKLAKRLSAIFKKQPENYQQFLALEDLFEANTKTVGVAPKKPARPAPPVFRNW